MSETTQIIEIDQRQENAVQTQQQLSPELQFLQSLFNKFNENKNHEELSTTQKVLLQGIADHEKQFSDIVKELEVLGAEITERQTKIQDLRDRAHRAKGSSDALANSLIKLNQ